ncbi:MAG: signal transduction histidine kinase [Polaribacter sp.]|jgi:signal transduction histidine kinase
MSQEIRTPLNRIVGDPHRLTQVLNNYLSNAIKLTKDGEIKLLVSKFLKDKEAFINIQVVDNGIGI